MEVISLAAKRGHRVVERAVARMRGHILKTQIRLLHRRQNAHQRHVRSVYPRRLARLSDRVGDLFVEVMQAAPAKLDGQRVELNIKEPELGDELRVIELGQDLRRAIYGAEFLVDQEHLLLGA